MSEDTDPLSVVHVSIADGFGGAARSAYKVHSGVRDLGLRSRMLVAYKFTPDPDVAVFRTFAWKVLDRPARALTELTSLQYLIVPSSLGLLWHPWMREADVVQIYNTHGGYLSHLVLSALSRRKPVVWRLSDMWAMTGHVAYSLECERWRTGCGGCPHLHDYPGLRGDRTALNWRIKKWVYERSKINFVAPSHWIEHLARASPLLRRFPVTWIPNGVDLARYRPRDRAVARQELGIPSDGILVMHSATDARKGGAVLAQALRLLRTMTSADVRLLTIGRELLSDTGGWPAYQLGHVSEEERLAVAYAAADVFVLPSLADNLPNTILESFAAGTPVVAFDVGGIGDAVRDGETGALVPVGAPSMLARRLAELAGDAELRAALGRRARAVAEAEYSLELQARRFADLYRSLVP